MAKIAAGKTRRAGGKGPAGKPRRTAGLGASGATVRGRKRSSRSGNRGIENLFVAFAHDIRTPLSGILALSDLLATSGLGERERGWVATIKDTAEHLTDLTTLIVEGARTGAGRAQLRRETFDLSRFATALAASLAARAETKKLACVSQFAADLPTHVHGSPAQLRIALENLIANAVKFTEHGQVGLAIAAAPLARGRLRLSFAVTDSGIGMTKTEIRRLFRPFAQANRDIVTKFGGAGLGLVEARRLARAMGGDVTVASTPGQGSTFCLTATVDRAEPSRSEAADLAAGRPGATPDQVLHILCVEDNPHGRVVMNAILSELGHRVDFAASGEAAMDMLAGLLYDVVLMDITLPGMNGREATRRIRALPGPAARVPTIGISGHAAKADIDAALAAGMNAYFPKPVSPRALAQILEELRSGATEAK
jgi:two-component system, sensor histidine kinase